MQLYASCPNYNCGQDVQRTVTEFRIMFPGAHILLADEEKGHAVLS